MHKEYILFNGFRKAKKGFTAGFHVPLSNYMLYRRAEILYNKVGVRLKIKVCLQMMELR